MKKTLKTLGMLPRRQAAFVTNPKTVLNIISNLSLVTSLTLDCEQSPGYPTSFKESFPFIAALWASFGQNLRFIRLKVPLDAVHDTISSVKLPNLQDLSLDFSLWCRDTAASQVIVDFIHNHADTLRFLGIYTRQYLRLFQMLRDVRIPMLDSFQFYQFSNCTQIDTAGLQPFLSTYSRTLKTLDLQFHSYNPNIPRETWLTTPVTLPKLQSLIVELWWLSDDGIIQCLLDYVVQYSRTLVSLDVSLAPCSYDQIHGLTTQFSTQGCLRKLGLLAKTMTPQLLVLLSNKLPFLEELTLRFYRLATPEGQVDDQYAEEADVSFCCHSVTH